MRSTPPSRSGHQQQHHGLDDLPTSALLCPALPLSPHPQVYAVREIISPNPGFVLQLREWERSGMDFTQWKGWSRQRWGERDCCPGPGCKHQAAEVDAGPALGGMMPRTRAVAGGVTGRCSKP